MKKAEIIEKLVELGAGNEDELNELLKDDLQAMLDKAEDVEEVVEEVEEVEEVVETVEEVEEVVEAVEEVVENVEEEVDLSKLTKAQLRVYQRTGVIPE